MGSIKTKAFTAIKLRDRELLKQDAFINNEWVGGDTGEFFHVRNPATSEVIAELPDLSKASCELAIDCATGAFTGLKQMSGKDRGKILRRWYELVMDARDDLAAIITAENGKTLSEAKGEVAYAADFLDWFSAEASRIDGSVLQSSSTTNRIVTIKQPVGIAGIITPWNFPAAMVTRKVAPAIAAGCPCIVKPAAETPLTALALAELGRRAGLPRGALSIVTTMKHTIEVGKVLTENPLIRKFSFTGSTAVGKLLAAQCTGTVKRVSLELGGNAPVIVFNDADIHKAVDGIISSKFRLSGQTCVCANRVYVQAGIYDRLASAVVKKVNAFKLGPGTDSEVTHGPLISKAAVQKVDSHVQDALNRGAKSLTGGSPAAELGDSFFQPTVLIDVPQDSLCVREETFGPLLPLLRFQEESDVLRMANSSRAGLAGYFFTENVSRAWRVAEQLEVGMVGVNTGLISDVASPFGGVKESGVGREVFTSCYRTIEHSQFGIPLSRARRLGWMSFLKLRV